MSDQNKELIRFILEQQSNTTGNSELFYQDARKFIETGGQLYDQLSRKELKRLKGILKIARKDATFSNNMPIQNVERD
ncbi:hypothetical protein IPH67_00075 [bacterium]|nr:MAG: hypothetical protein IPH67_00075 [bacterium]